MEERVNEKFVKGFDEIYIENIKSEYEFLQKNYDKVCKKILI